MKRILVLILTCVLFIPFVVSAESKYLYDVLKDEAENNGLAREYTGNHKDSYTEEPSKKIYHWYAANDSQGNQIPEKNNVVFANQCWKMLRTTDTGGVKLWYNGEVNNGNCLNTREKHVGYNQREYLSLNSEYWYGTDYEYDPNTKKFSISGTTEKVTWNDETGPTLIGKYTCQGTSESSTCDKLYLIQSYSSAYGGYALTINSSAVYSTLGYLPYNSAVNSIAYVGYKYGNPYPVSMKRIYHSAFANQYYYLLSSTTINSDYWYADSISYDSSTRKYTLNDPYKLNSNDDSSSLIGKYTLKQTNESASTTSAYYIVTISNSYLILKELSSGHDYDYYNPVGVGDSITDNNNGTYTINDVEYRDLADWYNDNKNGTNPDYKDKYVCNYNTDTCSDPRVSRYPTSSSYATTSVNTKLLIAKRHDGLQLLDTTIIRGDEMYFYPERFADYKYTCGSLSDVCSKSTLKRIPGYKSGYYEYIYNYYYGSDVTWDGTNYTLVDPIGFDDFLDKEKMNSHHYFCLSMGDTSCSSVGFFVRDDNTDSNSYTFYITLSDGKKIDDAMKEMLEDNTEDSIIKFGIDSWYKKNLLNYSEYLEDTIFCNNRVLDLNHNGWQKNGDLSIPYSNFASRSVSGDLSCEKETDQFSVSNQKAKLTYPIGLLTSNEVYLFNNNNARKIYYPWLITPSFFHADAHIYNEAYNQTIYNSSGSIVTFDFTSNANASPESVIPVISVNEDARIINGNGTTSNPYQLSFNPAYSVSVQIVNETEEVNVDIEDMTQVEEGETVTFKVTPIDGYKLNGIQVLDSDNNEVTYTETNVENQYSFTMPASNVTIIPSYKKNKFKVDVTITNETEDFDINIENLTSVLVGETVTFKATPITGYKINSIQIKDSDNNDVSFSPSGNANEYSFTMPESDVTILPIYERVTNSIDVEEDEHTKEIVIEVNDVSAVVYEDNVVFTVEPEKGYEVDSIDITDGNNNKIDYEKTENKNEYQFIMPASDVTIKPNYKKVSNAVSSEDNEITKELVIEVNDATAVVYEDTVKFTVTPVDGYEVETIIIKDKDNHEIEYRKTNNKNEYEFIMPDTDVVITPVYRKIPINDNNNTNNTNIINPKTGRNIFLVVISLMCLIYGIKIYKNKKIS